MKSFLFGFIASYTKIEINGIKERIHYNLYLLGFMCFYFTIFLIWLIGFKFFQIAFETKNYYWNIGVLLCILLLHIVTTYPQQIYMKKYQNIKIDIEK